MKITLTFDDGPNSRYTLSVLKILKTHNIKACFFLLGKNVERYPEIARRIKREGHLIGNHTYSHKHLRSLSPKDILWQIERCEEAFKKILKLKPKFIRMPYGEYNRAAGKIIKEKGYRLIGWDPRIDDWKSPVREIISQVISGVKDGSIITLHDGANIRHGESRIKTVKALPDIVSALKERNIKIVRLDRLCRK